MTASRKPLFRRLAVLVLAAHAFVYALAPFAEARTSSAPQQGSHIERSHSESCVVLHKPDACVACQLAGLTAGTPLPSVACVPEGTVTIVALPRTAHRAPRTASPPGLHSRAPPAFIA